MPSGTYDRKYKTSEALPTRRFGVLKRGIILGELFFDKLIRFAVNQN